LSDNKFKVLEEKTVPKDQFEEKTHEKVAETLYNLITKNSDKGLTIGLEGGWGSGKSTVISILKDELEKLDDTKYFYFDAWSHEGDPLRRVFLESLIEQVDIENEKLREIADEITNKKKITKVKSKQTITGLGKIFAVTSFLVPIGITFISFLLRKYGFILDLNFPISLELIISILFSLAPVLVLFFNGVRLLIKHKSFSKVFISDNWIFLQNEASKTTEQEISDDNERSSIEFEKYFNKILTIIFKNSEIKRLLIIIDNLDRVAPKDTLKIWSTLQTFLQERNPSGKVRPNYDKLWIIVPYDPEGLKKVWENHTENNGAKSFFDKCFQLRLEVPRLLMSGWESFCKTCMDDSLLSWSATEKKKALDLLRWTRNGVLDSPSPREIKTFVNQIGVLRIHSFNAVLTESIAYFTIKKYLKLKSNREIQDSLLNGELPEERLTSLLDPNKIKADFSSLIFGVPPEKSVQILLEPKIEKVLKENNFDYLKELVEIHKSAFWTVFELHITKIYNQIDIINYCHTIYKSIINNKECSEFIQKFITSKILEWDQLVFPNSELLEKYKSLLLLIAKTNGPIKELCELLSKSFVQTINQKNSDIENDIESLIGLITLLDDTTLFQIPEDAFNYETWIFLAKEIDNQEYDLTKNIKLPANLINEMASKITPGSEIPEVYPLLVKILIKSGYENWENVIDSIEGHINWNNGNLHPIFSIRVFEIIQELLNINDELNDKLAVVIKNGIFWNLAFSLKPQGSIKMVSLILARIIPKEFDSFNISIIGQSQTAINEARIFWNTSNEENSEFVWDTITKYSDYGFLWDLENFDQKKLIVNIIQLAINEKAKTFFSYGDSYNNYKLSFSILEDESRDSLAERFIEYSNIENELTRTRLLELTHNDKALFYLLQKSKNKKFKNKLVSEIKKLSQEQWKEAFEDDSYLLSILDELISNNYSIDVNKKYLDAFLSIVKVWISGEDEPSDWLLERLKVFYYVMSPEFQEHFSVNISRYVISSEFAISNKMKDFVLNYIDHKTIFTDGKQNIQDYIEKNLQEENIEALLLITKILKQDTTSLFKPDKRMTKVLKDSFTTLSSNIQDTEKFENIKFLANLFNIKIDFQVKDEKGDDSFDGEENS